MSWLLTLVPRSCHVKDIQCYNHEMKTYGMTSQAKNRTSPAMVDSSPSDGDELLLPSAAARELGYSTSMIRVWTDSGRLPVTRLAGGVRVIRRRDIRAFAATRPMRRSS